MIASATSGSIDYAELTKNLIATLQFNGGARPDPGAKKTPSTHSCHNCNKLDHWSPNCPEPRKTTGTPFTGNPNPNHSRPCPQDNGNVTSQDGKPLHWRRVPPAVGESELRNKPIYLTIGAPSATTGTKPMLLHYTFVALLEVAMIAKQQPILSLILVHGLLNWKNQLYHLMMVLVFSSYSQSFTL